MGNLINYKTDRGIALLVLNDPPVNSYTHEMIKDLDEAITDARFDEDVHVLVVAGHGEHSFCAGANISMLREVDPDFRISFFQHAAEVFARIEHSPKLVIAALNGHAVGGGLSLALACDLRIARHGEGTISLPELHLGIIPETGGMHRLVRVLGKGRAMQMILEGTPISFETALTLGLVNYVWDAESSVDFLNRVIEYARQFTPPNKASLAVGRLKRAIHIASEMSQEHADAFEREMQSLLVRSEDANEGLQAWIDKRVPSFHGK